MTAVDELCILRDWKGYLVPRTLEGVAHWLDQNRGPAEKPEGEDNTSNLIWLATPSEGASGRGHPKFTRRTGFDLAFTHGAFFDVDGPASAEGAFTTSIAGLERAGYGAVYSRSHNASETDPWRGHIQLVFDSPCPARLHARVWKQLHREIFPLVQCSQHSPVRGRNGPKPGASVEVFPGALVDWRAVLARSPADAPEAEPASVAPSASQLPEHDAEIAESLAAMWQPGTTGERAFGALGGWLYRRGVSHDRALGIAARVAALTEATGDHAERRVNQAYDGSCPLGRPALLEALGQDGGKRLGGGAGLDSPEVLVVCELDRLEELISESTRATSQPEPGPTPDSEAIADPLLALEQVEAQIHAVEYRLEHPGADEGVDALVSKRRALRAQLADIQKQLRMRPVGRSLAEIRRAIGGEWETPETINYRPRPWVCRRLAIAPGRPVSVSAYGGLCKTWLIEALAVSVASGVSLFGADIPFERKGAVLYVSREQDLAECRGRLTALCNGVDVPYRELIRAQLLHVVSFPDLDFSATKATSFGATLREWALAAPSAALVVIDSQIAMAPGTDQNTDAAATSLRVLQESLTPLQCASVILMHENKGSQTVDMTGRGNLALKGSASLNNATSVGIRLQALTETLPEVTSVGVQTTQSIYAEFTRCQIGVLPKPFILRPDLSQMNDADAECQVALLPAAPVPEAQTFRKGRLVSDAADPEGVLEPLTPLAIERAVVTHLHGADATSPARVYPATALRTDLVHILRAARFELPKQDKAARALLEGMLAALPARVLHRDATDSAPFVQGRLRRKGAGFWFEVTSGGTPADLNLAPIRPSREGSAQARADALLAELEASRIGIICLPAEYDHPLRKLSPQRQGAIKVVEAGGPKVLRVDGIERAFLVDPVVVRRMPWKFLQRQSES